MARKSSSGGILGGILLLIIAGIASIPIETWIAIAVVAGLGFVAYVFLKTKSAAPTPPPQPSPTSRAGSPQPVVSVRFSHGSRADTPTDPNVTSAQCWVPPGRAVSVGDVMIPGGMLYVGSRLPAVSGFAIEPALIDPKLSVHRLGSAATMPYWPSYSEISSDARGEYLNWLAGGRRSPVQIGCVFLFFYGLERRVLHDLGSMHEVVAAEVPHIAAEVNQLLSLYGGNNSFRQYASRFEEILKGGAQTSMKVYEQSAPEPSSSWRHLQFVHKLALGQVARDGVGLPASWAYSWLMHDEMTFLRKPAERCPDEFKRVFTALYNQRFPRGMLLPVTKTRLKLSYRPASASFGGQIELQAGQLPDVTVLERPINELRALADEAADALDPYSRFIGRNPDKRETMDAIVLKPPVLWPRESLVSLVTWVKHLGVERAMQATSLTELMRHFPNWGAINKDRAAAFASALEHFGVGMEPDVRWGGPTPSDAAPVVLFAIPHEERGKRPSSVYSAAALTMHLSTTVSAADGLSPDEERHLEESVDRMLHLQAHERLRLRAHLKWLFLSKPTLTALKKRVAGLDASQRGAIGAFVVNVAHVEGGLAHTEMKTLAKVYRLLELPEETLYREAHAAATEPVVVKPGEKATTRFKVPPKPSAAPAGATAELDAARIARLKEESARVSVLLGHIFADAEHAAVPEEPEEAPLPEPTLAGLDVEHSHFAKVLLSRDKWTRAELEDLAADRGIMLDGALEQVNEAFAEAYGEPLIEGHDPVDVNKNVLKELEAA